MRHLTKLLLLGMILNSFLYAKTFKGGYFTTHGDMCDKSKSHTCSNKYATVIRLQKLLNRDKNIHHKIKVNGKWNKETKKAVQAYQKHYALTPVDGWVRGKVKNYLDFTASKLSSKKKKTWKKKKTQKKKKKKRWKSKRAFKKLYLPKNDKKFNRFKRRTNLKKSFKVYKNHSLLKQSKPSNTQMIIDTKTQRVTLLVKNRVALNSPCTTGAKRKFEPNTKIYRDKHTPKGNFRIIEKIKNKHSNIFGDFYKNGKLIYHGDRRKFKKSRRGVKYVGASLKYWMRLTSKGIGLHESKYVKRHTGTNGCIRLPKHVAKTIFSKVRKGTQVRVQ